jgi:hypothetical protein
VNKYNERDEQDVLVSNVLDDFAGEIVDLFHALKKEKESFGEMGIDFEEKAFYDILKTLAHKYDFTYPEEKLITLAKEVKTVVDDKAKYTDWSQRDDIKAELKVDPSSLANTATRPLTATRSTRKFLNKRRISRNTRETNPLFPCGCGSAS